jgi:hypothetical protein
MFEALTLSLALSIHHGFEGDYNGIHPHLRYNNENYIAGIYYNSERNISPYLGKRFEYNDFGVELGAVGNYSDADIAPYARGTYKYFFVAPGVEGDKVGIVFGLDIPLSN